MSPTDVFYRSLDAGRRRIWARRQVQTGDAVALPPDTRKDRVFVALLPASAHAGVDQDAASELIRAADSVLDGTWTVLGSGRADSADPDWFHDPATGRRTPDARLAFRIHQRAPEGLAWIARPADDDGAVGWYSPRFAIRVPATSLVGQGVASSSTPLTTELELP